MTCVAELQVVVDGRGADPAQLSAAVRSLLRAVPTVQLAGPGAEAQRLGPAVRPLGELRRDLPLLLTTSRVTFADGATRRILRLLATPGRSVVRVVVPGLEAGEQVACWSAHALARLDGDLAALLDAGLGFDREQLPGDSPTARFWVRGDDVGVALTGDAGDSAAARLLWARRTGLALDAGRLWGQGVRAPAGAARRRYRRWQQRRAAVPDPVTPTTTQGHPQGQGQAGR